MLLSSEDFTVRTNGFRSVEEFEQAVHDAAQCPVNKLNLENRFAYSDITGKTVDSLCEMQDALYAQMDIEADACKYDSLLAQAVINHAAMLEVFRRDLQTFAAKKKNAELE